MADVLDKSVSTPVGDAPVVPVALMVTGLYLCWFGVHYWRSDTKWPSDPIKAVLTGKPIPVPDRSAQQAALDKISGAAKQQASGGEAAVTPPGGAGAIGGAGGSGGASPTGDVAEAALKYQGQGYSWGGPADRPGNWDCSSFVSYVLGHDLKRKLPGGGTYGSSGYPPTTHGPTTIDYLMFGTPVTSSQVQAGDLVVSSQHMGIVTSPGEYMSAHSPRTGTSLSSYLGDFPGGAPVFRRIA